MGVVICSVNGMYLFMSMISVKKQELRSSVQLLTSTPGFYNYFLFHLISFSMVRFYTEP